MKKSIDIVIITYNCKDYTINCIKSIYENNSEIIANIIIVDNNSDDDSISYISKNYPNIKIIKNSENFGYAKAVNIGFMHTQSEIVIFSNADVIYKPNSITNLIDTFNDDALIGVAGPQQYYPNGKPQYSWGETASIKYGLKQIFFIPSIERYFYNKFTRKNNKVIDVSYADGAVLAIRREVFIELNGFDEDYFFYSEEADFCFRAINSGKRVVNNPKSEIIHYRGVSSAGQGTSEKSISMLINSINLFCQKHLSPFETNLYFKFLNLYYKEVNFFVTIFSLIFSKDKYKIKSEVIKTHLKVISELNIKNGI